MKANPRPLWKSAAKLGAVLFAVWGIGLIIFVISRDHHKSTNSVEKLDGIIVLTGGSGRLETGLTLLQNGAGNRLLLSGVHQSVTPSTLAEVSGFAPDIFVCCVDLDYQSESTVDNAAAATEWVRANGYRSIYLVTSDYHMPRSLVLFQAEMPDILITAHPVATDISPRGLVMEYNKYLVTLVGGPFKGHR